ncbi:MAG: DHHW family protein [Muribaculaceae bacterium]
MSKAETNDKPVSRARKIGSAIYIFIVSLVFVAFAVVFNTFPRSTYSPLEKRELATFPSYTIEQLASGEFTKQISSWYSDSEPFRDDFLAMSMQLKDLLRLKMGEEQITFHASDDAVPASEEVAAEPDDAMHGDGFVDAFDTGNIPDDGKAKITNAGILIVGSGDKVRALMAYGGNEKGGVCYANAANKYKETFGDDVNVYCMVIPTAIEFYCPEKASKTTMKQSPTINNIHAHLNPGVLAVDVYTSLGAHSGEDIYLRTDHHWAPLGAFYAAKEFARVAKVPFKDLSSYTKHVIHHFVGSMYGYSKDISLKNAPEDFVYYVPKDVNYETTYINYILDSSFNITGVSKSYSGPFFYQFKDGNGGAYSTFMGSDMKLTKVTTSTHNGRRLIILKDSFGNALPGYLFYSFEELHVIDARYFTKNMVEYVRENAITDILFANNIYNAYSSGFCSRYAKYLKQTSKNFITAPKKQDSDLNKTEELPKQEPAEVVPEKTEAAVQSNTAVVPDSI